MYALTHIHQHIMSIQTAQDDNLQAPIDRNSKNENRKCL